MRHYKKKRVDQSKLFKICNYCTTVKDLNLKAFNGPEDININSCYRIYNKKY